MTAAHPALPDGLKASWKRTRGPGAFEATVEDLRLRVYEGHLEFEGRHAALVTTKGEARFLATFATRDEALRGCERAARREARLRRDADLRKEGATWTYALRDAQGRYFVGLQIMLGIEGGDMWARNRKLAARFNRIAWHSMKSGARWVRLVRRARVKP